ncbi:ASCH domain-containing protein [Streptomyces pactum]|uniref:ASCH domain-containing protein n=1 Tax=Streptomyces pactum TaxID=68249 RepID=A0ABS0NN19_9ACTN|nr:ASCH domain-containing protein [Streptomyces pactum]MBH5336610.1 ASCH domain-containing protein [Streptomyces pactum]
MWPRVDGMRGLELGSPGAVRDRLNALVLAGEKRATTVLLAEYAEEAEGMDHPGERQALLDNDGRRVATLEITGVATHLFGEVPWEHAAAEGEGDASVEEWRAGHRRYWAEAGTPVDDATPVVCVAFRVLEDG